MKRSLNLASGAFAGIAAWSKDDIIFVLSLILMIVSAIREYLDRKEKKDAERKAAKD